MTPWTVEVKEDENGSQSDVGAGHLWRARGTARAGGGDTGSQAGAGTFVGAGV